MRGIQAVPRNRERTQEYQRQARHLLMELDPIGVPDTPEAADEYDYMIDPLQHRPSRGTASITPLIPVPPPSWLRWPAPSWRSAPARPPLSPLCRRRNQAALATPLQS